jgi:hypothetical protein
MYREVNGRRGFFYAHRMFVISINDFEMKIKHPKVVSVGSQLLLWVEFKPNIYQKWLNFTGIFVILEISYALVGRVNNFLILQNSCIIKPHFKMMTPFSAWTQNY